MADCISRGRFVYAEKKQGSENPCSKLSEAKVLEMRRKRKETGISYRKIAQEFGMSTMAVYNAIVGNHWRHLG